MFICIGTATIPVIIRRTYSDGGKQNAIIAEGVKRKNKNRCINVFYNNLLRISDNDAHCTKQAILYIYIHIYSRPHSTIIVIIYAGRV